MCQAGFSVDLQGEIFLVFLNASSLQIDKTQFRSVKALFKKTIKPKAQHTDFSPCVCGARFSLFS
jgi:hypothetical protein